MKTTITTTTTATTLSVGQIDQCLEQRLSELDPAKVEEARKWIAAWKADGMKTDESRADEAAKWIESWKDGFDGDCISPWDVK